MKKRTALTALIVQSKNPNLNLAARVRQLVKMAWSTYGRGTYTGVTTHGAAAAPPPPHGGTP